jgi:hypothetical protein
MKVSAQQSLTIDAYSHGQPFTKLTECLIILSGDPHCSAEEAKDATLGWFKSGIPDRESARRSPRLHWAGKPQ